MTIAPPAADAPLDLDAKHARLQRLRWWAWGVLIALAAAFAGTFALPPDSVWTQLARRMAEAGMIGGLADWFAVEALFRRPLGLPIPHTALLPRNQQRVAANVGRFVETYIVDPRRVGAYIRDNRIAERAAAWLLEGANASHTAKFLARRLGGLARVAPPASLIAALSEALRAALKSPAAGQSFARAAGETVRGPAAEELLDSALNLLREAIELNRESAAELVRENSKWWTPKAVDRYMADLIVQGAISAIDEMAKPGSRLRADFMAAAGRLADGVESRGGASPAVQQGLARLGDSAAVESLVQAVLAALQSELTDAVDSGDAARRIEAALLDISRDLQSDPEAMRRFNRRAAAVLTRITREARPLIGAFIQETLQTWDPRLLTQRFELEIGPDLQFIRINGAVLGALLGAVFFGFAQLLGG